MKQITRSITHPILVLLIILISFTTGNAAEIDDSTVFVEAFNAYQRKDFLLTIEKCDQLNQVFPDSPLRDITLLLIARASLKSGDNEHAAKYAVMFSAEFPESSLKSSVEDELTALAKRHQNGEILAADKKLQIAAAKVRSDALAREREAKLKLEIEQAAKARAEQERLARIKLEEELREKERRQAEERARASIKAAITLHEDALVVPVDGNGRMPIEITNEGKSSEDFLLAIYAAKEYNAILARENKPAESIPRITLAAGETFKGVVALRMPSEMSDGNRSILTIKAVSARFSDISFQKETVIITSAPLIRAVAKLAKQKVTPGEKLRYHVTVLNAGSLPAYNLTVRVQFPPQIDYLGTANAPFNQETDGTFVFTVDKVDIGSLSDIFMDVKVRENSAVGHKLLGHVEVVNGSLHRKDLFPAGASVVQSIH